MKPSSRQSKSAKLIFTALTPFVLVLILQSSIHARVEQQKDQPGVGIDEKLGQIIPLGLTFCDEKGQEVSLRQLIHTPTILAPVYFSCPDVCSLLLYNVAKVLNQLPSEPGKEYLVLAISFDETEKPALALQKKRMYLKMIEKPFPEEAWKFLTGEKENIQKLTDAMGVHFKREGSLYLVTFWKPIDSFTKVKTIIQNKLLTYIQATQGLTNAHSKLIYECGR